MSLTHTQKDRLQKKVTRYAARLRGEMWLDQWYISVLITEYPGDSTHNSASISPANGRHRAELEVSVEAADNGGETLRHILVHELTHLYLRDSNDLVRLGLIKELSNSAYQLFWESFRQSTELMTDDLARAWAETLPLPDWPKDSDE